MLWRSGRLAAQTAQMLLRALYEAAAIKPAIVQNRFYRDTGYDKALRAHCRERGFV